MGPKFFQTMMGKRFFDADIPSILIQLKRLNDNLERIANALEERSKDDRE